jgi:hypothetical protein
MLLVIAWIVQHLTPFQNLPENLLVAVAVDYDVVRSRRAACGDHSSFETSF